MHILFSSISGEYNSIHNITPSYLDISIYLKTTIIYKSILKSILLEEYNYIVILT